MKPGSILIHIALICVLAGVFSPLSLLAEEKVPQELTGVGITEHLGSKIDLSLKFNDESGVPVTLGKYFNRDKPVLFFLVYYECPNLCTFVLNAAVEALGKIDKLSGRDFEVVVLSFDPKEDFRLANAKRQAYLDAYHHPEGNSGWHFLTGRPEAISQISDQLGFHFKWDEEQKQFAHASAFFVLSPEGMITRYFYGISYAPQDVKLAIIESAQGHLSSIVDKIILFCYHYDGSTKKYVLLASRLMTAGGALTVVVMTAVFGNLWLKERKNVKDQRG